MDEGNKIFYGESGLLKFEKALAYARGILKSENLSVHPDFLLIEPDNGVIGTAVADRIGEHLSFMPVNSDRKVVLIRDAHVATKEFQNAILKFVEDGNVHCTFLLTTQEELPDTIQSRCATVKVSRYSDEEMMDYIKSQGMELDTIAKALAAGRPGIYRRLMAEEQSLLRDAKLFMNDFLSVHPKLAMGRLLDEKPYEGYSREQMALFLEFFQNCFFELLKLQLTPDKLSMDYGFLRQSKARNLPLGVVVDITSCLMDDRSIKGKYSYGKNEFFQTIRHIYTLLSGGGK